MRAWFKISTLDQQRFQTESWLAMLMLLEAWISLFLKRFTVQSWLVRRFLECMSAIKGYGNRIGNNFNRRRSEI